MAVTDRRVPAVYIDVEDRSYVGTVSDLPRNAYCVIVSDRGPHDQVVELTSWSEFELLFGKPNYLKTGQAHYLCYQHLKYSNKLNVVRVADDNAAYSNISIKHNDVNGSNQPIYGNYTFTFNNNIVVTDANGLTDIEIGDVIYSPLDSSSVKQKVIDIINDSNTSTYTLTLENPYQGSSATTTYLYKYYNGSVNYPGNFIFTNGSNVIVYDATTSVTGMQVGDWIYADSHDASFAKQIIDINIYDRVISIDSIYEGATITTSANIYKPFQLVTQQSIQTISEFSSTDSDNIWTFFANGVGSWYNNIIIKAIRNIEYETVMVDNSGNPLFKYAFMDIGIYEKQSDGSLKLLEGPWIVSTLRQTPNGDVFRNIVNGEELYIESVINKYSKLIKCISALGVDVLYNELARLQVLSLFSEGKILKLDTIGSNGLQFESGTDGNQYNSFGNLDLQSNTLLRGKIIRAYNGTLVSRDGSVENISQVIYPWYSFNYVYCGGYDSVVQNAARELVENRQDCLCLADCGSYNISADEDIYDRKTNMAWNTMHAAIYSQFRTLDDPFTGKVFYITPVYDAIERHLLTDANYWYSEPVANIEKGAISRPTTLAYKPNFTKLGDLITENINPTISESEGVYFITQLTTYKRLSILKRQHAVKFIHFITQEIPKLLKDILQRKHTQYWITQAEIRISTFMAKYLNTGEFDKYASIESFNVNIEFDEVYSELIVTLTIKPIRAIERISVRIIVA